MLTQIPSPHLKSLKKEKKTLKNQQHGFQFCFLLFQALEKRQESLLFSVCIELSDEPIRHNHQGSLITGAYPDDAA